MTRARLDSTRPELLAFHPVLGVPILDQRSIPNCNSGPLFNNGLQGNPAWLYPRLGQNRMQIPATGWA